MGEPLHTWALIFRAEIRRFSTNFFFLVDEETIQSRTDSIKSKLQRLSTLLENKKPLKKEDQFVDKMKDFEKKAGGQLEGIDKLITNYKKEFSKVVINFFMEDAKLNVKELFESIAIFLNDLQVSKRKCFQ